MQPLKIACSTLTRSQPFHPLQIVTAPARQAVRFLGHEGSWLPNMLSSPGPRSLPPCHAIASPKRLAPEKLLPKMSQHHSFHSFAFLCIPLHRKIQRFHWSMCIRASIPTTFTSKRRQSGFAKSRANACIRQKISEIQHMFKILSK